MLLHEPEETLRRRRGHIEKELRGVRGNTGGNRQVLFDNPDEPRARDLVGLAISFPESKQPQRVEAYLESTVGWIPVE